MHRPRPDESGPIESPAGLPGYGATDPSSGHLRRRPSTGPWRLDRLPSRIGRKPPRGDIGLDRLPGISSHDGPRTRTIPQDLSILPLGVRLPFGGAADRLLHRAAGTLLELPTRSGAADLPIRLVSVDRPPDRLGQPDRDHAPLGPLGASELAAAIGTPAGDVPDRHRTLVPGSRGRPGPSRGGRGPRLVTVESRSSPGMGRVRPAGEPLERLPGPPGNRSGSGLGQ